MAKKLRAILTICLILALISGSFNIVLAHSGRTDANGGHRDNKNVSRLGPYHYHCNGNPPHLHSRGTCPYKTVSKPTPSPQPKPSPTPIYPNISQPTRTTPQIIAIPTSSKVLVNDKEMQFESYTINDSNFFKLHDLAFALNGTTKQFEVFWDDVNETIMISNGLPYTEVGGEMSVRRDGNITPLILESKIMIDGVLMEITAYSIMDNTF